MKNNAICPITYRRYIKDNIIINYKFQYTQEKINLKNKKIWLDGKCYLSNLTFNKYLKNIIKYLKDKKKCNDCNKIIKIMECNRHNKVKYYRKKTLFCDKCYLYGYYCREYAEYYCRECMDGLIYKCVVCNDECCDYCFKYCDNCMGKICFNDECLSLNKCLECNGKWCTNCYNMMLRGCENCSYKFCFGCHNDTLDECGGCNGRVCSGCTNLCKKCGDLVCNGCDYCEKCFSGG